MLIQLDNNRPITSHHALLPTLAKAVEVVDTRQPALALQVGSDLDPGIERKQRPNEDTLFVTHGVMPSTSASTSPKPFALFMVADGMGGQGHGQEASQLAVGSLVEYVRGSLCSKRVTREALLPLLIEGVKYANRVVHQRNQERRTEMGTTMTATLVVDTTAYVAHVGDSRLYLYRPAKGLSQITQDHSMVAALVAAGVNQPEDIYTHPMRNLIYRFLGEKSTVEVDASTVPLAAGDILLLCSDGLWEMVRDRQIAAILTTPMQDPSREAHALLQAALAGGGVDNVSVIVVQVSKREHLLKREGWGERDMLKMSLAQEVSGERQEVAVSADTTPLTLPGLYEQLRASEAGLTSAEARMRLGRFGADDPTAVRRTSVLRQLLTFVANPLVVILFIASIVSATLGEVVNASIAEYTTADERDAITRKGVSPSE
jgi:serine/threonine protein phosphatase PrpC